MRVLIVQWTFHPNTAGWVDGLRARGHDVVVLVSKHNEVSLSGDVVEAVEYSRTIEVISRWLGRGHARLLVPRPVRFVRQFRRIRPDLVLVKQQGNSLVNSGPHVLWTSILAGVTGVRRCSWGNRAAGRDRSERLAAAVGLMPRRHFVAKRSGIGACHNDGGIDPVPHVPYAVAVGPQRAPRRDAGPVRVLTVGRLSSARKQVWWTLDAAHHAGLLDGRATYTFVGPGRDASVGMSMLRERIAAYGCHQLVTLRGRVPNDQLAEVYAAHDLVVVPSRTESFGMVVLEAMAAGVPVLTTVNVGARCCVLPGVTGAVADGTIESLATELARLVAAPEQLAEMGEHARAFIARHADPPRVAAMIEALAT